MLGAINAKRKAEIRRINRIIRGKSREKFEFLL
jgi:hypothetical protein